MNLRACVVSLVVLGAGAAAAADPLSEANALYRAGNYDAAVARYGDAQAENAEPSLVQFNLGNAQYRRNRFDEAEKSFERASDTRDALLEAKARYNIGNCRYRQGKLPDALEAYRKTIELLSDAHDLGSEQKKVLADAQANYEFVQNKIKEQSKSAQQPPQNKDREKQQQQQQKQQQSGDKKEDQPQSDKDKKDKEKDAEDKQEKQEPQQAQAAAQKDEKEAKSPQEQKDGKDKARKAEIEMSKEEAARLLETFGRFQDRRKIQDKFNADAPRPAKDW